MAIGISGGTHRRLCGALALAGFLIGVVAGAQTRESGAAAAQAVPRKPAWQWTLDERLAARFDPEAMKARVAQRAASNKQAEEIFGERLGGSSDQHTIDGHREPELLLPIELVRNLINNAFPEDGQDRGYPRRRIEEGAAALGLGSDFWQRLEKAATPYLQVRNARYRRAMAAMARSEESENPESDDLAHCRSLAQALAAAKAEFGEEIFLRLLYREVAPTMAITYNLDEGTRDRLRSLEGGCK